MAKLEVLEVKIREEFGKRRNRRMRETGLIPVTLYGHQKEAQSLSVSEEQLKMILGHGGHIVQLSGDSSDRALLKEVQWDVWGKQILHVDLARVDAFEKIHVTLPLILRGEAAGVKQGGVVEQLIHEIELECSATNIPDSLEIKIGDLEIGGHLTVTDIELPEGTTILLPENTQVVHCVAKRGEVAEEGTVSAEGEPEVISKKKSEEDGE
ncbi:MAG: 50S ribosomal protein L25 [Planctomycetia bacterium]|nr:50S ribosomal protein L25 [Planctomycetia bacterium]